MEQDKKPLCRLAGSVLTGIVVLLVAACARTNTSSVTPDEPEIAVEDTEERVKITRVEPVRPKIPLTEDLAF